MEAFHFVFSEGAAKGYIKYPLADGISIYEYPNATELSDDALTYYCQRASETANNSLKIRYLQILFSSAKQGYLSQCTQPLIDSYVLEVNNSIRFLSDHKSGYGTRQLIKSALLLSKKAKYKTEEVTRLLFNLANPESTYPIAGKYNLLKLIFEHRRLFTKNQIAECYSYLTRLAEIAPYVNDLSAFEKLSETALKFASALQQPVKEWYEKLGALYETEIGKRAEDTSNMMPMHWCEKAIIQYQLAGNTAKVQELHLRYEELRKGFKLDTFETELNREELTKWYDSLDKKAKYLVGRNEPEFLINYLSQSNEIFPNIEFLKESAQKRGRSFLDAISISKADVNKNFSKKVVTDDEHEQNNIYETYQYYLDSFAFPYLRKMFYYGFIKQKICFKTIIEFLQANTWMGNTFLSTDSGGKEIKYNWLSLIAPALFDFHFSLETLLFSKSNHINIVLPIDSLVLKFEGLFRDFARLVGSHTTTMTKGYMREMYIEELLELEKMKQYFDEDDMLLFKYLFISKNGLNLRNNIAHSFLHFNDYRIEHMILLIMALLRLGKYSIDTSKQTM